MNSKHILVISQYFYPESFRINDICCEWIKRGYKVTVLTGIPNYPEGKFYKGYSWFKKRREHWNDIEIIRIPLIARGKSSIGMIMNYISFVISGFFWSHFTGLKADCVFTFEVSPMTQALIGVWFSKRRKIHNYLYVQDLWPENVEIITGIHNPAIIRPIQKMVDYIYRNNDLIFAASPGFVRKIQERLTEEREKVIYWPQYAEDFYRPVERHDIPEIPKDDRFKVVFTGNIGQAQGLDVLVDAAKVLSEEKREDICFVIIGNGRNKEQLKQEIIRYKLESMFIMIDKQPAERIPELLSACDAAFVSFMDNDLFAQTIPAKLQSYMACGMPIIAAASGETERIVREAQCGVCCRIGDGTALTNGIICMKNEGNLKQYSSNARRYFLEKFEKKTLMDEIDGYFQKSI